MEMNKRLYNVPEIAELRKQLRRQEIKHIRDTLADHIGETYEMPKPSGKRKI